MKIKVTFLFLLLVLTGCSAAADPAAPTVDPFIAAAQAERTAAAAQEQAAYYGSQLTATAEAPIVAITATAAAWQMQQQYAQATQQSAQSTQIAAMTATAQSWTPTPNLTATMQVIELSATAQVMANDVAIDTQRVQRAQSTSALLAMSPYIIGLVVLFLLGMLVIAWVRKMSVIAIPVDSRGNPQPMFDVVEGVAFDADRMTNGALATKRRDVIARLPQITAERQDAVTMRDQLARVPARQTPHLPAPVSMETQTGLFPLPSWELADSWQGGPQLPYGLTAQGLGLMDLNKSPHIVTVGKTGSGKSRRFLRPLITFALSAGQRVVILGKTVDFLPFTAHPNCTIIPVRELTLKTEAQRYALFLKAMVEEMNTRDAYLTTHQASTWTRAGRESTLVVLDELGNALDLMPREYAEESYRYITGLVKEGRKMGMNVVMATQRVKGFRDVMTEVSKAVFYVEDAQESRYAGAPGANQLPEGYFIGKFGAQRIAGGFEPTDDEIRSFLGKRMVQPLEPQQWLQSMPAIDAPVQESLPEPTIEEHAPQFIVPIDDQKPEPAPAAAAPAISDEEWRVLNLHAEGKGASAIVKEVWGITAGTPWTNKKRYVEQVIASHAPVPTSTTTSTTSEQKSPEMGTFQALPA